MTSVQRSMLRYLAAALGDEWEVRPTGGSPADEFGRPFVRVGPSTPESSLPLGARHVELRQSFAAVAFPVIAESAEGSALEAARVSRVLLLAFAQGVDEASFGTRSGRAHPLRVPLFDYSGVPLGVPVPEDRRTGYARVLEGPDVDSAADPADPRAFVVTLDVRLSWTQAIGRQLGGQAVEHVTVGGEAS